MCLLQNVTHIGFTGYSEYQSSLQSMYPFSLLFISSSKGKQGIDNPSTEDTGSLESVAELGEKGKNLLSKAFMWTRAKSATLMEEVAKKVNAVSEAEQIRTVPQQVDQSVFTVDE